MRKTTFNPDDMPILNLDTSGTGRHEASHFLDNPVIMDACIAESINTGDAALVHALGKSSEQRGHEKKG
jgi:hypothetical protein